MTTDAKTGLQLYAGLTLLIGAIIVLFAYTPAVFHFFGYFGGAR